MGMNHFSRLITALLFLFLFAAVFIGCAGGETNKAHAAETTSVKSVETGTEETIVNWNSAGLPTEDFEGRKFNILTTEMLAKGKPGDLSM